MSVIHLSTGERLAQKARHLGWDPREVAIRAKIPTRFVKAIFRDVDIEDYPQKCARVVYALGLAGEIEIPEDCQGEIEAIDPDENLPKRSPLRDVMKALGISSGAELIEASGAADSGTYAALSGQKRLPLKLREFLDQTGRVDVDALDREQERFIEYCRRKARRKVRLDLGLEIPPPSDPFKEEK